MIEKKERANQYLEQELATLNDNMNDNEGQFRAFKK